MKLRESNSIPYRPYAQGILFQGTFKEGAQFSRRWFYHTRRGGAIVEDKDINKAALDVPASKKMGSQDPLFLDRH